jgi:putative ABC transport system permease protein
MTRVALRGLLGRKLRASLTAIAVVIGVAMVSGTYILTDTIKAAFNTVFTEAYKHADAVITGRSAIGNGNGSDSRGQAPSLPESLLARVRGLPQVAQAAASIADSAQLVGHDGKVIGGNGAPGLAFSYTPAGKRFNPLTLASGNWPSSPAEIDIDAGTATDKHFHVGQRIGVVARGPVQRFKIAGTVKFGGVSSLGGATLAIFTLPEAQKLFHKAGLVDQITVAARPGTTPAALVRAIRPLLPGTAQIRTGQQQAKQATSDTSGFLTIFQDFLLAFGGIALFVGSFVIANTLSITIAQRTRELATLRTLGATRGQVLRSVMLEALVIGAVASVIGLFLGLGLAAGLNSLLVSFGIKLPQTSTVLASRTIEVSLAVGIIVTLLAALRPALRATRVAPVAAVREGSVLPPSRLARFGRPTALATMTAGLALMLVGSLVKSLSTSQALLAVGIGAVALLVATAIFAPVLVPPLARTLGWPATRLGASAGRLARSNAARDPARTASTAAALMIGLALVTTVGVLAAGLKAHFNGSIQQVFVADYFVTSTDNFTPIGVASENALRRVPGVLVDTGVRAGDGRAFGSRINVTGVDPVISQVVSVTWQQGSQRTPAELGTTGAFVNKDLASRHHLHVGSTFVVETPSGRKLPLVVRGIPARAKAETPYGDVTISTRTFDANYQDPQNVFTFVNIRGGESAANTARLKAALQGFPDAKLQTKHQWVTNQLSGLNTLLNLLYVLLSLSILVSLFGIVNTLVLTVFERTRELGMLRAVGMTPRQVRRMIRHESVITALLGAALGIPLGVVAALLVGAAIKYSAFTIPVGTLVVFVIAAIIAGLVAAIFPARRAGRLNVLEALQYE